MARKRNLAKQTKMPDLSETSETESVKGNHSGESMDSESDGTGDKAAVTGDGATGQSSAVEEGAVFPSLPDKLLAKMGLHVQKDDNTDRWE